MVFSDGKEVNDYFEKMLADLEVKKNGAPI